MKTTLLPTKGEDVGRSDPVSIIMAVVVLFLNFLDARFTMIMLAHPIWSNIPEEIIEMNPLWQEVIKALGMNTFMISKTLVVLTLLGVVLLAKKTICRNVLFFITGYYVNLVIIQLAHIWMFTHPV